MKSCKNFSTKLSMTKTEEQNTKEVLVDWINHLHNPKLIQLLNSIRLSESEVQKDWWEALSEPEKKNIELGLLDRQDDKIMTSSVFWKNLTSNG